MKVLALDLEGTLISNAISVFPRPGLFDFLESCNDMFDRVVMITAISEDRFRKIARQLSEEGSAPPWFHKVEYINWHGNYKDLKFVPGCSAEDIILVDDQQSYVHPDQLNHWVEIAEYLSPYSKEDNELEDLRLRLARRLGSN